MVLAKSTKRSLEKPRGARYFKLLQINLMNTNYWMKYVVVRPIFKKRSAESLRNYEKVRNFAAELTQWKNLAACDHLKKC